MVSVAVGLVPRERFSMAGQVLERLLACTPEDFELVVVDAGTPARFRADMDRVLEGRPDVVRPSTDEILLPNEARNVVTANTAADWICFLENDVLVEPGWLSRLLAACEEEKVGVAAPLIVERFGPFEQVHFDDRLHTIAAVGTQEGGGLRIEPRPDSKESDRRAARRRVDFIETHCMLFSRQVLERTGLFDPSISAQEEMDVSLALHAHSLAAVLEPAAVVSFHPPPPIHAEEREFYLRKWDPESYAQDYQRVAERWQLIDPPSAMGVVETRRSYVSEPDPQRQVAAELAYRQRLAATATDLAAVARSEGQLILVHDEQLNLNVVAPGLEVLPFLEQGGLSWGPPPDDATAIAELERMRAEGATVIAFAWPSFWWLDHYGHFTEYLRASYRTVLTNDRLVAFDLTDSISAARNETTTPRTRRP
ncbi:MAG: glycosyltransferase, partial [Actinomycetota bacterium]|nr:glycosyltransferase [Actinomycetota bacterium]